VRLCLIKKERKERKPEKKMEKIWCMLIIPDTCEVEIEGW
jgi:hypothetical protein